MKRKLTGLFCLSIALIYLSGCSNSDELEQLGEETINLKNQIESIEETSSSNSNKQELSFTTAEDKCEITKYVIDSGMYHYAIAVLTNISDEVIDVVADVLIKDDNNKTIGIDNNSFYNIAPGKEIAFYSLQEDSFSDFDVNLSVECVENPSDIVNIEDLKTDISRTDNKLIISTTNNTVDKNILITNVLTLYFKDGELVDFDNPMFEGMDGINPGQTSYVESHANADFDDYKFYYDATIVS